MSDKLNPVEELIGLGIRQTDIAYHTGLTTMSIYRHKKDSSNLKKIEIAGYKWLIAEAKKGKLK